MCQELGVTVVIESSSSSAGSLESVVDSALLFGHGADVSCLFFLGGEGEGGGCRRLCQLLSHFTLQIYSDLTF